MGDILVGKGDIPVLPLAKCDNRHSMVAGAVGKSVSLMVMAEGLHDFRGEPIVARVLSGRLASPPSARLVPAWNDRFCAACSAESSATNAG